MKYLVKIMLILIIHPLTEWDMILFSVIYILIDEFQNKHFSEDKQWMNYTNCSSVYAWLEREV